MLGWMSMETPPQPAPGSAATPEAAVTALALDATPALPGAVNVEKITEAPVTIATSVPGAGSSLSGKAYVDKVELVYVVSPLEDQQGETGAQIVQPAWRFSGHTPVGAKFEITFQAVLAQYIK